MLNVSIFIRNVRNVFNLISGIYRKLLEIFWIFSVFSHFSQFLAKNEYFGPGIKVQKVQYYSREEK